METLIKKTREVGTSAGVLLPRKWLNKQVVVTLSDYSMEEIANSVLKILFEKNLNEEAKGIYLFGSYARGEQDFNSDIDILVITKKINRLINKENYEISLISEDILSKNLPKSLFYQSALKEAKTLINKELIEKYVSRKFKLNLKNNLKEIKGILKINKESARICEDTGQKIPDGIIYSIVLRLRELYLITCLLSENNYYKKNFVKFIDEKIYSAYLRIKREERELNNVSPSEIKKLYDLYEKWLKEIKD